MLTDSHGRHITYLRLAVTDRCNLRCSYCMPAEGLKWLPRYGLMSYEEMLELLQVFASLGITKLRFTGGEPFLRRDFMQLVEAVCDNNWFQQVSITTNGTLTAPYVERLKALAIHSVNLSVDTMNPARFARIAHRDDFAAVKRTFDLLMQLDVKTRLNAVIMEGLNEEDLIELTLLTRNLPLEVRFIEEMPFNGTGNRKPLKWNHVAILRKLETHFGPLEKLNDDRSSTSANYHIPGFAGSVGIIAAWSRTFCGTCNRLRLTPQGQLRTCLYSNGGINLLKMLRNGAGFTQLKEAVVSAVVHKPADGHQAEQQRKSQPLKESMATIGG